MIRAITRIVVPLLLGCPLLRAQANILTANGGNDRANANLQETRLSPATVSASRFGKLTSLAGDGQIYAQPLYVSGFSIGGATLNVLFVATMHNSVYAYDADSASHAPLWQVNLGPSVPAPFLFGQYGDIGGEVGILGTPVIDLQRSVIYVVTDTLENGAAAFFLHALDLATGNEKLGGPARIQGAVQGSGSGGAADGTIAFNPAQHIQRPSLLLVNGAVHVAFGSHGDQSPYHGWLMSYDAGDLTRHLGTYMSTPNGDGGAFWQSGRGPAADGQGNIYGITGNGDYDGVRNFAQSFVKLAGAPPARIGSFTLRNWKAMSDADADISAGPALISGMQKVVGADKTGNFYLLDVDAMEHPDSAGANTFQVFTISASSIFNFAVWSRPGVASIYVQGHGEPLKCFQLVPSGFNSLPRSTTVNTVKWERIGMTLSADGATDGTGILWEITGNYNDSTTSGTLHAYDASNLASELWNSDMNPADTMGPLVKFVSPTVANGKVFVPTLAGSVVVYGPLTGIQVRSAQPVINSVTDAAGYSSEVVSPGELVAIFGSNLGPTTPAGAQLDASGNVTTSLANTQVLFDGVPAPMVWAGAGQVNAVVPFGVSSQVAQVQVQYQNQMSNALSMPVAPSSPGIFSMDGSGSGQGAILNQDGSINSFGNPAPRGAVITLYATGAGGFSPAGIDGTVVNADNLPAVLLPLSVEIGGIDAEVLYAGGAPGLVEGVVQVNARIPAGAPVGAAVPVILSVGNRTSQSGLTVAVQ